MDNQNDKGKKSAKIYTLIDTSEDESEEDVPPRVWLEQAQLARDAPATTSSAADHAVPGPSGQSSHQRQSLTSHVAAERWKTFMIEDSLLGKRRLETMKRNEEEIVAKSARDPLTKDMMTALDQILNNADKSELKKSVEKYYNRRQSPPSPLPGTSGNWEDIGRPPNLSVMKALRETNIKLEKEMRRTNSHFIVGPVGEFDFPRTLDDVHSARDNKKKKRRKERIGSHSHERDERPNGPSVSSPRRTTANRDHGPIPAKIRKLSHNVINPREINRHEAGASVSAPSTDQEAKLVKKTTQDKVFRNLGFYDLHTTNNVSSPRESISNKTPFDLSASSVNTSVALEDTELPSTPLPSARVAQQATEVAAPGPEAILAQDTPTPDAQVDQQTENPNAQVAQAARTPSHKVADNPKNMKHEPKENNGTQTELVIELQLNQALLGLLECPVCLEWMEPPMVQCRRGHLVCNVCRTRMPRCPVCRASFTSVRNRAMEQVAEKLGFPCRYGCGAVALLRKRERHEASCPRRSYACPLLACAETAPMSYDAFKQHHLDQHPELLMFTDKNTFLVNPCTTQQKDWIVYVHMQVFHVQFSIDNRNWGLNGSVTYFGPKKNARKYLYEISVAGNQNSGRLIYSRDTHSDLDMKTTGCMRGDTFFIPSDHALNFMRPERNTVLPFTVSIQPKDRGEVQGDCNTL